jgi:uncharacterized membrane protein (DUF485 family)
MSEAADILRDPKFQKLLQHRSRWRWGFSIGLVGSYLIYIVAGIYIPDTYAVPFVGSSVPWGVVLGYLLIALSIVLSVIYVRVINKLESVLSGARGSDQ